jgi:hypothetical protein
MPSSPPYGGLGSVSEVRGTARISRNPRLRERPNSASWLAKLWARSFKSLQSARHAVNIGGSDSSAIQRKQTGGIGGNLHS